MSPLNATQNKIAASGSDDDAAAQEYLTFTLGPEEYAIDILKVQEIRGYDSVTKIANAPVIILNIGARVVGIVVDSVSDVITLSGSQIRPAPEFSATLGTKYLLGLGTLDDRMLIVVDIEKLMLSSDMALVDETAADH